MVSSFPDWTAAGLDLLFFRHGDISHIDTRVLLIDHDSLGLSKLVLVKDARSRVFNELALGVVVVKRLVHVVVALHVVVAEDLFKSLGCLPGVVVGDLGADMVSNVSLADAVEDVGADGAKEIAVDSAQGAALKVPLALAVVGKEGVGVLKKRNENEMMVDNKVRNEVISGHF